MTLLKNIKKTYHNELNSIFGEEEVSSFFHLLIAHYFNITRLQLAMDLSLAMTSEDVILMDDALEQLKQQKPIQYIIGETEFFGLPFKLDKNVLIPRPETEELVNWIIETVKANRYTEFAGSTVEMPISILDIGTGSGCIAISLAKNLPNAKVYALDVSKDALNIALENAKLNDVDIQCLEADILDASSYAELVSKSQKFDIVVSNPPYVRQLEKNEIKKNVIDNEPHLALFVEDDNPLKFYRAICEFSVDKLKDKGLLFFEINAYLGQEMKKLVEEFNFKNIELKQDIFYKDRMIKAIK